MKKLIIATTLLAGLLIGDTVSPKQTFTFNEAVRRGRMIEFVFEDGTVVDIPTHILEYNIRMYGAEVGPVMEHTAQ